MLFEWWYIITVYKPCIFSMPIISVSVFVVPHHLPNHTHIYLLLGVHRLFSMFLWMVQWVWTVGWRFGSWEWNSQSWYALMWADFFVSCWWSLIRRHRNPLVVALLLSLWSYILCVHLVNCITPTLRKRQMVGFCAVYCFVWGWGVEITEDISWWSSLLYECLRIIW